jgi:hypothetical protein
MERLLQAVQELSLTRIMAEIRRLVPIFGARAHRL